MVIIISLGLLFQNNLKLFSIVLFIILYMLQNIRRPIAVELISNRVKSKILASGLSAESFLKVITTTIFSLIAGYLADLIGIGYALTIISLILIITYPLVKVKIK